MEDKEIKALIYLIEDPNPTIVSHVEEKIVSLGDLAIPHLEQALDNVLTGNCQKKIQLILQKLGLKKLQRRLKNWNKSEHHDLLTATWIITSYQYPNLKLDILQQHIDRISHTIRLDFRDTLNPMDQIKIINDIFFHKLNFRANSKEHCFPNDSLINAVLRTKTGSPIVLSILYMLIAHRLNLPVYGVNFPDLFVLTYQTNSQASFYINVSNQGIIFSKKDMENYVAELQLPYHESFFNPCPNTAIVCQLVCTLVAAFGKIKQHQKAEDMKTLLAFLHQEDSIT